MTGDNMDFKRRLTTAMYVIIFIFSLTFQSFVSYTSTIEVYYEFGLQAILYFLTLIMIGVSTKWLVNIIREMFGTRNNTLENEIK
jgi:hypothetical protein